MDRRARHCRKPFGDDALLAAISEALESGKEYERDRD
jgi:hypothetical protein